MVLGGRVYDPHAGVAKKYVLVDKICYGYGAGS